MNHAWVVDASVAGALLLADEHNEKAAALLSATLASDGRWHVPALWWYEVDNLLLSTVRRKRMRREQVSEAWSLVADFPLATDVGLQHPPAAVKIFDVAAATGLSAYDAAYAELALRLQCGLATLDAPLRKAAKKLGLRVW